MVAVATNRNAGPSWRGLGRAGGEDTQLCGLCSWPRCCLWEKVPPQALCSPEQLLLPLRAARVPAVVSDGTVATAGLLLAVRSEPGSVWPEQGVVGLGVLEASRWSCSVDFICPAGSVRAQAPRADLLHQRRAASPPTRTTQASRRRHAGPPSAHTQEAPNLQDPRARLQGLT